METSMNRVHTAGQTEWVAHIGVAAMTRATVKHVLRSLTSVSARVVSRVRRIERPREVALTILAIVVALLFLYLLVATPFTQYGW